MSKRNFFEVSSLAITVASLITAVGCGSAPGGTAPAAAAVNPSGLTGNLYQRCAAQAGTIYKYQGADLCRAEKISPMVSMSYAYTTAFPILDATRPTVVPNFLTPVQVFKGDKVTFSGQANWGTQNCNTVDGEGNLSSTTTPSALNGGIKAGLVATDRTKVYFLGTNNQGLTIQNNGYLSIGLNVPTPAAGTAPYCGSISVLSFRVLHCENASATIACPF